MVDLTLNPKVVQSNEAPGSKAPSAWAALMSVCHVGQALTSA